MSSLARRLAALEERVSPTPPDLSAAYAGARERMEAILLSRPEPYTGPALSEEEIEQRLAEMTAALRARMAERRTV